MSEEERSVDSTPHTSDNEFIVDTETEDEEEENSSDDDKVSSLIKGMTPEMKCLYLDSLNMDNSHVRRSTRHKRKRQIWEHPHTHADMDYQEEDDDDTPINDDNSDTDHVTSESDFSISSLVSDDETSDDS